MGNKSELLESVLLSRLVFFKESNFSVKDNRQYVNSKRPKFKAVVKRIIS